ncbi:MAG: bifunctional phosphopantothenoylcysteine decarboxylase/phosphopantothenate--cysteine ligase CoaBC [Burkholderiales bacterium]|jgi:phosphopantothenoylcysteine decarboxylase/phosphopantothenate--cysteine ligase|nr:bifunctional phosphopantothenoylcysteine decarboxylase/phosphopantothenate--cysteine ligase CoaBC [Burkholderiales bacterium]
MQSKNEAKKVLLGLTGGVAAYKAAELVRRLGDHGIEVQVVMTKAACGFITPATLQALSGHPVYTDMWDGRIANGMPHIELSRDKQVIVVAPATADFLAKAALGLADDLLSTLCLARDCPLIVAPAMNRQMWEHPATRRNVAQLKRDGVIVLGPDSGDQACGETGMGRMLEADELAEAISGFLEPKTLSGKRVLMTAGPTFEPIDAVRGITNRSSGKMGYALARAAIAAGAEVTLVSGPVSLAAPVGAIMERVQTAAEMFDAVKKHAAKADIFIGVAAVADYRVSAPRKHKIKKTDEAGLKLSFVPNPDILGWIASRPKPPFCVGFAAESRNLDAYADEKRRRKKVKLMIANLAQSAIGADDNEVSLLDDAGTHRLPRAPKDIVARQIVAHIAALCAAQRRKAR